MSTRETRFHVYPRDPDRERYDDELEGRVANGEFDDENPRPVDAVMEALARRMARA